MHDGIRRNESSGSMLADGGLLAGKRLALELHVGAADHTTALFIGESRVERRQGDCLL